MIIQIYIQAEKKFCGYCHFLHSREGHLLVDSTQERYWCEAFAQKVQADKRDRPLRVEDCLKGEVKE